MLEYKKRVRMLAERHGLSTEHLHDNGLRIRGDNSAIEFVSASKLDMDCSVITPSASFQFSVQKQFVFDIICKFASGRSLAGYAQTLSPLTVQEYIDEEHAESRITNLREQVTIGTAKNGELGGNHYNVEYYNGILIVFDIFTGAPVNVFDVNAE